MLARFKKLTPRFSSSFFGNSIIPLLLLAFLLCKQKKLLHFNRQNGHPIFWSKVARVFAKQILWFYVINPQVGLVHQINKQTPRETKV